MLLGAHFQFTRWHKLKTSENDGYMLELSDKICTLQSQDKKIADYIT